jgi:hypothetical protein
MPLSWNEIRHRAIAFSKAWKGETREAAARKPAARVRKRIEADCQMTVFFANIYPMDASVALADLGQTVDIARVAATNRLDLKQRSELGQILTPHFVAKLMADRLSLHRASIRLLDPGAGIGSLTAAVVERILQSDQRPTSLHVDAFEIDPTLADHLHDTLELCAKHLARIGVYFSHAIHRADFISDASLALRDDLFANERQRYDAAILNPPYRKIATNSTDRKHLEGVGLPVVNLYTAFLGLVVKLVAEDGELVATPRKAWSNAAAPLRGITQMMGFFEEHYGKKYAPNTRETVRRQTVHQFLEAGIIVCNPDEPSRPINSGKTVYQVTDAALALIRTFGTTRWDRALAEFRRNVTTLREKYAEERYARRIPVRVSGKVTITLSPGGQNVLVEKILKDFAPVFAPAGRVLYVGDTDTKFAYFDKGGLGKLGVHLEEHGKMPDVIIHYTKKNWLLLIEAVTSHGPVNPKRHQELKKLFATSKAGLVYVTAFLTRKDMVAHLGQISWETEVWVAESPTHMIHFNGERFLGPYPDATPTH